MHSKVTLRALRLTQLLFNKEMTTKLHPPDPILNPTNIPSVTSSTAIGSLPGILRDAVSIRRQVFVDEQGCSAEAEIDADDARSWHWVLYDGSAPSPVSVSRTECMDESKSSATDRSPAVGTLRLVPPCPPAPYVKITRVAVLPTHRGRGIGRHLVETAVEWAGVHGAAVWGTGPSIDAGDVTGARDRGKGGTNRWPGWMLVHAQVDVEGMYARLGFRRDEGMGRWMEEGIEHVGMWRHIQSTSQSTP